MFDKKEIIDYIYQNKILQLGTIQLKNGDFSDYFYDFGKIDSPEKIVKLSKWLVDIVDDVKFDALFTSAYKGIVIQTAFALEYGYRYPLNKIKFGYQRKEIKSHGEGGNIVGYQPQKGDRVLILDDVFTTGFSIDEMIKLIIGFKATPVMVLVSIVRSDEKTLKKFQNKENNLQIRYLVHDNDIVKVYQQYRHVTSLM